MEWVTTTIALNRLRDAEETTWQQFVERFRLPIIHFANGLGLAAHDAEDVAQETLLDFVKAYREGQYDRRKGHLRDWLFGIAYRRVLNARKKCVRDQKQSPAPDHTAFWGNLPDQETARQSWDESWQKTVLEICLEQVRMEVEPITIHAFELFAIQGKPANLVAQQLEMTTNAVFLAKHRVLKRVLELKSEFEDVA